MRRRTLYVVSLVDIQVGSQMVSRECSVSRTGAAGSAGTLGLRGARLSVRVIALFVALLAAVLYAVAGPVTAASAEAGPQLQVFPLPQDTVIFDADGAILLVNQDLVLRAGESRRLLGQVNASLSDPSSQPRSTDEC